MPISEYIKGLRKKIGHDRLLNPRVAALIRDAEGRILLQRRSDDGSWSLPAGAVDPGERPAEAVIREAYEETGRKVVPEQLAGVLSGPGFLHVYPNGDVIDVFSVVFLCRVVGGVLEARDGESAELRPFGPAGFRTFAALPCIPLYLQTGRYPSIYLGRQLGGRA